MKITKNFDQSENKNQPITMCGVSKAMFREIDSS